MSNYIEKNKQEADRYYRIEETEMGLRRALTETRNEPGLSLTDVAKNIKKVFTEEEVKKLKELL